MVFQTQILSNVNFENVAYGPKCQGIKTATESNRH